MFEKVHHDDLTLVMFEKVGHCDNLFSVSYRRELWKSFLVPAFRTVISLAWLWYVNKKWISRRVNLYIAHLPHFYESINNKFSNILKNRFSSFLIMEFWWTEKNHRLKPRNMAANLCSSSKSINLLTFQQLPLIVWK